MARHETNEASEEYVLPAVEAVLAGTLALMTGCAETRCQVQRRRMMHRIVDNMGMLAARPGLTAPFRCAVDKLRCHWQLLLEDGAGRVEPAPLRHAAPGTLQ